MSLLVVWVKRNFESLVFLAIGFVIPSLFMLVFEFFNGVFSQYLGTYILALTYSLPFVILTTIIIVITKKVRQKKYISLATTTVLILAAPCLFLLIKLIIKMF